MTTLTIEETAARLGLAEQTLANYRSIGKGPSYYKIGNAIRYDANDLEAWLQSQKVTPRANPKK